MVVEGGRVLLVRRGRPPLQGEWSVPGGALKVGEPLIDGVRRRLREETGLEVEPLEVLAVLDRIIRDEQGRVQFHYVLIDYLCRLLSGQACAASDAQECAWVLPQELARYKLPPETARVVEQAFARATA